MDLRRNKLMPTKFIFVVINFVLSGLNYLVRIDSEVVGVTTFNCVFNGEPTGLQWVILMNWFNCWSGETK